MEIKKGIWQLPKPGRTKRPVANSSASDDDSPERVNSDEMSSSRAEKLKFIMDAVAAYKEQKDIELLSHQNVTIPSDNFETENELASAHRQSPDTEI